MPSRLHTTARTGGSDTYLPAFATALPALLRRGRANTRWAANALAMTIHAVSPTPRHLFTFFHLQHSFTVRCRLRATLPAPAETLNNAGQVVTRARALFAVP